MLSRTRNAFKTDKLGKFDGITQVDETFVGGKNQKKSKKNRTENTQGRSTKPLYLVF